MPQIRLVEAATSVFAPLAYVMHHYRRSGGIFLSRRDEAAIPARAGGVTTRDTRRAVSANVDLVRSIYAQWERGDWSYRWADPDIEYLGGDSLESGTSRGIAAMDADWQRFREAWGDFHPEVEELRELDDRRVLTLINRSGRGKASGLEMRAKSAHLFEISDGKVIRFTHYWDRDRALADLGLEDQAASHRRPTKP